MMAFSRSLKVKSFDTNTCIPWHRPHIILEA